MHGAMLGVLEGGCKGTDSSEVETGASLCAAMGWDAERTDPQA